MDRVGFFKMCIDEEGELDIDSNHNMLVIDCYLPKGTRVKKMKQPKVLQAKKKWKLKWENFEMDLQEVDILYKHHY